MSERPLAPEELSDSDLLARHTDGDTQAFGVLVGRHKDRLWSLAVRITADPHEAADALQDAFLSAFKAAGSFRGAAKVTTWLHRIVVNACLDRLRRRQRVVPVGELTELLVEPSDPAADVDTALMLQAALLDLPAEQRAALLLVDVEGYSVAEAALLLQAPEGTVKSRCSRGRAALAVMLSEPPDPALDDEMDLLPDAGNRRVAPPVETVVTPTKDTP